MALPKLFDAEGQVTYGPTPTGSGGSSVTNGGGVVGGQAPMAQRSVPPQNVTFQVAQDSANSTPAPGAPASDGTVLVQTAGVASIFENKTFLLIAAALILYLVFFSE